MKTRCVALNLILAASLLGQGARLNIQLDPLAAKASGVVNVNLDKNMLQMGGQSLLAGKPGDPDAKQLLEGLEGIYVRVFEFADPGAYTPADLDPIRTQLTGPNWVSFVDIIDRAKGENVAVYAYQEGGKMGGMVVLAAEPKELVLVNIVGPIDFAKLGKLSGHFGIPNAAKLHQKLARPATTGKSKPALAPKSK